MTREKLKEMKRIEAHVSYVSKWVIAAAAVIWITILSLPR